MNPEPLADKHATNCLKEILESIRKEGAIDWKRIIKKNMMMLVAEISTPLTQKN